MTFPVLTVITFIPAVAAIIILMIPADRKSEVRVVALAAGVLATLLSLWVYISYNQAAAGYQFVEQYPWVPQFGISYHVGVDGLSLPLVLLTSMWMVTGG